MDVSTEVSDTHVPVLPPPPGFKCFSWPKATGGPGSDPSLFDFSAELPGWFPMGLVETSGEPPSLPISPILRTSSRDEPDTSSGTDSLPDALSGYSPTDLSQPILTSPAGGFLRPSELSDQSRYP